MTLLKAYKELKFCTVFSFFESFEDARYLLVLDNYMELPDVENIKELEETRDVLKEKYDEIDPPQQNELLDLSKMVVRLQSDQQFILNVLFLMGYKYSGIKLDFDFFENILAQMDYKLNYTNIDELEKEIDRLRNRAINKTNQINRKNKEIEDLIEKKTKEKKGNTSYLEIVLLIESMANIKIDIYKDSMLTFISAKKRMIEVIKTREQMNAQNKAA